MGSKILLSSILDIMVFMAIIMSVKDAVNPPENIEDIDGEISVAFWSFAFVLLLVVTVWFYITQIAPMRRSVGQIEEIDKEEEVAKRILEHLSDDLRFKNDKLKEESLENVTPVRILKEEDPSVYEYIDDEIHIHYSQYAWDDENCDETDIPIALGAARRHSMENMDLIFPGLLPSIVEEEECDEETDTESSEKSQDTDIDGIQDDKSFSNLSTVYQSIVNNNGGSIESSANKGYNYPEKDTNIVISLKSQESQPEILDTKQDRVTTTQPAASNYSRYTSENVKNASNVESPLEAAKTDQNDTSLLSRQTDNRPKVEDTEHCQYSVSNDTRHSETQESVIATKCQTVTELTSGGFDISSDKADNLSTEQNIPIKLHENVIECTSLFTLPNCDLEPSFKQDANENEDDVPKLCGVNMQKISCPTENGLDQHSIRDVYSKYATNEEHDHGNTAKELLQELSDAPMEDTRGLAGIDVDTNRSQAGEFQLNGYSDDIADYNGHTTHAWTFFSMSGSDELTAPEKQISNEKLPLDQVDVPTIIIDSYEDGLQSENKSNSNENSVMNGHEIISRYGEFETDIDIDDIDLIDSDELENEGEFSIYFKKHVSVTDLDKILSEEGQTESNGDSSKVLETDLSTEAPCVPVEEADVDISKACTEILQDRETNQSGAEDTETNQLAHIASETRYIDDESDMNIDKSVVVSTRLSDCLDKQANGKDFDETDSWSDSCLSKGYTVESLFDDVSFQKDGVYGELVISKLNENHSNEPDESSFDPYGEDWYGFSEELKSDRKPFLFTIPEDEEIGLAEFDRSYEEYFGGTRDDQSYDNNFFATMDTGQDQLLKAPIASVEADDSDFDLDEKEETEETKRNETEKSNGGTAKDEQQKSQEIDLQNNISFNGVTESNGIIDSESGTTTAEDQTSDKILTHNGVTENGAKTEGADIAGIDNTRSVKIVKKIKIFVRKEVNVAKDDRDLTKDFIVSPKHLIENPEKDETSVKDATCALEEVKEDVILPCRECSSHRPYEVVKSEIVLMNQFMEPLTYEEENCPISQTDAKNMKVTTKKEHYIPANPKPKSVVDTIKARVPRVEADVTRDVAQLPVQSDKEKVDIELKEAAVIVPRLSSIVADTPESDIKKVFNQNTTQDNPAKNSAEFGSRAAADTVESRTRPAEVHTPETHETKEKLYAEPELEARVSTLAPDAQESDNTRDITNLPPQIDKPNAITKPESKLEQLTTVETPLSSGDTKECLTKRPAAISVMRVNGIPNSSIERKSIKARALPVQDHAQDGKVTVNAAPEQKVVAKTLETRVTPVKAKAPERDNTRDAAQLSDDRTINAVNEKITETDTHFFVQAEPDVCDIGSKSLVADPKRGTEHTRAKPPQESPPVKVSIQEKDLQDGKENSKVRSPISSPTPLDKRPRKTYLTTCNIRLTKSHEDLRFVERAPEYLQESIQEEESPDVQSPQSELSETPTTPDLRRLGSEDDAFESVEPPSIHTAKITVQEVIGDRQRIVILNVKKKVHGKARWKSLNDLDSIKMALAPQRRRSDLGTGMASFAEEEETIEENETRFTPKVMPIEVKSRQDRKSLPEMAPARQPRKSPILKVTALQGRESVTENKTNKKAAKTIATPVLQEETLRSGESVPEIKEKASSPRKLPIIKATTVESLEFSAEKERKSEIIKATVTPTLQKKPTLNDESVVEAKETKFTKQEFKARVLQISPKDEVKAPLESTFVSEEDGNDEKVPNRVTRVHDISQVVEVIPRLERETIAEIKDESTKGNKIKVRISQRVSPSEIKENIRPHPSPTVEETPKTDREIKAGSSELLHTADSKQRQGRKSGYGSLGASPSSSARVNHVFVLEGANERSVSSLSSIDDEVDGETLGESRVMVTDLDALLAQQVAPQSEDIPPKSPEIEKPEAKEKVRVLARMEPVPEKVVRINKDGDEDKLVVRHVKHEEPIVVEPILIADAAQQEESQVISAFLVNDGYDDDELDEVFFEEYTPYGDCDNAENSHLTHSSDADSETSSVNSLPLKHRHRHTRGSLEASSPGVRNRTESSGSSKTTTPVAELENEMDPTSSGSSTPDSKAHEISREESFSYKTPKQSLPTGIKTTTEYTSAFTSVSRMTNNRRPRARSHGHRSDEELPMQDKGLPTSFQDVKTLPGLSIDKDRFKEAADARKSMPDLSTRKEQPLNDSPYLRGLSAHTRRWLSQNVWMDSSGQQDEEDLMTSDLFLYPSNRFQPGSNIDASFLSLANERDFPDDISVSTLSTRPQSPMSEFSFAGETPYWGLRRGSTTVIKCSNPRCEREEVLFGGEKTTYTSCPACFTYYCTRACRRIHWSEHKKVCFFGRINSYIRSFIYLCHKKEALKFQLSKTAKDGHKKKGRGSVMVTFASAQSARKFMTTGCMFFPSPPTYSSLQNVQAEGVISKHKVALMQHIKDYEPDQEFVLNLAIIAGKMENLPANPVPRRKVNTVLQVVKIPLSSKLKETSPAPSLPNDPNTEMKVFYLPKCARHEFVNENEARRHYCRNISKNLKQYGIRLKHDYPDVYEKLCLYVDQNIHFTEPLTVYGNQGKKIVMCKIMPEAGEEQKKA